MPYAFYANGIVFGTLLLIFGAILSAYPGWLIILCCEKTKATRYEDIALSVYGLKM
jgi:amino acid permease